MKKMLILTLMLIGLSISLFAYTKVLACDSEPKYRIIYEVINPKFVPDNFSCSTWDEQKNHHFQIPEALLKELTNEELVRYILSTTEFIFSSYSSVRNNDFSGFNGYTELISRADWASDIIQLPEKYKDKKDEVMLFQSLRFATRYDVFTKLTLPQQQQILTFLKSILLLINKPSPEFEFVGAIGADLLYWVGVVVENYYPSKDGKITSIGRGNFQSWVKDPPSLILSELQKAIDSGKHIEVIHENND